MKWLPLKAVNCFNLHLYCVCPDDSETACDECTAHVPKKVEIDGIVTFCE